MDHFPGIPGTPGTSWQIPGGLFLCAGAALESHRLAVGVPADTKCPIWPKVIPRHPNIEPKVSQSGLKASPRHPNAAPGAPKCVSRLPQATQWHPKESQGAMQASKNACAFQTEFEESLYTQKLPINRSSGHYVTYDIERKRERHIHPM